MPESLIAPVEITGNEVNAFIVNELLPVANGKSVPLFSAAALTLILCSIRPGISEDDLSQGLQDVSSYITIWISELDNRLEAEETGVVVRAN